MRRNTKLQNHVYHVAFEKTVQVNDRIWLRDWHYSRSIYGGVSVLAWLTFPGMRQLESKLCSEGRRVCSCRLWWRLITVLLDLRLLDRSRWFFGYVCSIMQARRHLDLAVSYVCELLISSITLETVLELNSHKICHWSHGGWEHRMYVSGEGRGHMGSLRFGRTVTWSLMFLTDMVIFCNFLYNLTRGLLTWCGLFSLLRIQCSVLFCDTVLLCVTVFFCVL
jgi:hypothetical protein